MDREALGRSHLCECGDQSVAVSLCGKGRRKTPFNIFLHPGPVLRLCDNQTESELKNESKICRNLCSSRVGFSFDEEWSLAAGRAIGAKCCITKAVQGASTNHLPTSPTVFKRNFRRSAQKTNQLHSPFHCLLESIVIIRIIIAGKRFP